MVSVESSGKKVGESERRGTANACLVVGELHKRARWGDDEPHEVLSVSDEVCGERRRGRD